MRIELTFPDQSQETADLKSGTGTSSVTSPIFEQHLKFQDSNRKNRNRELNMLSELYLRPT